MTIEKRRIILLLVGFLLGVLIFVAAGCSKASQTPDSGTADPATSTSLPPEIYHIDFENPEDFFGWHVGGPGTDLLWLENTEGGKYVFEFASGFLENWDQSLTDVEISVDIAFQSDDPADASVGCRMSNHGAYWFTINNARHWTILKYNDGQSTLLAEGDSDAITNDNHLVARCVGAQLSLQVNDQELGSVSDDDWSTGGITLQYSAFAARSGSFDNLIVLDLRPATEEPVAAVATLSQSSTPTPIPTATLTPSITPIPSPTPEWLLYANMFDGEQSGLSDWIIHESIDTRHFDRSGPFVFDLADENNPNQSLDALDASTIYAILDQRLPAQGWVLDETMEFVGSGNATHALVCGYSQSGWYELAISSAGHWSIALAKADSSTTTKTILAEGNSDAITSGINRLKASCIGDQLSLEANGQSLGTVSGASLPFGDVVGFTYQEEASSDMHLEISRFFVTDPAGKALLEYSAERDSFYFAYSYWAISADAPRDILSLLSPFSVVKTQSGSAQISLPSPGRWMAIYPEKLPYSVEVSLDVDARIDTGNGFGVICRWDENLGGYALWYAGGGKYVITSPFSQENHGDIILYGASAEYATTEWASLLEGTRHHIVARCWGNMVQLYIDGYLVSSHDITAFPMARDRNKSGLMVGLMWMVGDPFGATATIDNLTISTGDALMIPVPTFTP